MDTLLQAPSPLLKHPQPLSVIEQNASKITDVTVYVVEYNASPGLIVCEVGKWWMGTVQ